ncbi:MAG: hypothetical protein J2P57_17645, partial [Acidimicrobiaceae bacterium]|nr:hypothetical protein [Acidimicrobiaceae bacterium]
GVRAQEGASTHPWLWNQTTPTDLVGQANFYQQACSALSGHVQGIAWWDATLDIPDSPGADEGGFIPFGKPAEASMKTCFAENLGLSKAPQAG